MLFLNCRINTSQQGRDTTGSQTGKIPPCSIGNGVGTLYGDGQEIFFFYMLINTEALGALRLDGDK